MCLFVVIKRLRPISNEWVILKLYMCEFFLSQLLFVTSFLLMQHFMFLNYPPLFLPPLSLLSSLLLNLTSQLHSFFIYLFFPTPHPTPRKLCFFFSFYFFYFFTLNNFTWKLLSDDWISSLIVFGMWFAILIN